MSKKTLSKPAPLPECPAPERGPVDLKRFSITERNPQEPPDPRAFNLGVLDRIRGRLIKRSPFAEPILGLEILDGPYAGIVFTFTKFLMLPGRSENGLVPTRYETELLVVPDHLHPFDKDADFDTFTTEIVLVWLNYLHTNDIAPLLKAKPLGRYGVQ